MANDRQDDLDGLVSLPSATAQAARAVFNIENVYLVVGDNLDRLVTGIPLACMDTSHIFHHHTVTLLALMTVFQFTEDLPDRQACASLSKRMDWKYALHLPIEYSGLDTTLLCRFRQQLLSQPTGLQAFDTLLERLAGVGLLGRDKRGTPASQVVEYLCDLNQLERFHEAVCEAIEVLACRRPDLLRKIAPPHWYDRYQSRQETGLQFRPVDRRESFRQTLGADARYLIQSIAALEDAEVRDLAEVRRLMAFYKQQYDPREAEVAWRHSGCDSCVWHIRAGFSYSVEGESPAEEECGNG